MPPFMKALVERLNDIGYAKTRRALAALSLSFFVTVYLFLSFNAPPGWGTAFLALSGCYLIAFIGVVAEWFWGSWFAGGLGWSGMMVAGLSLFLIGWAPPLVIYGALHGLIVLFLAGKRVAALYEMQEGWREKLGMDEHGVSRLRKTVTRSAASLPSLILWAFGPKDPGQGMAHAMLLVGIAGLGIVGLGGLLRLRTWGAVATLVSAVALIVHGAVHCLPELQGPEVGTLPDIVRVAFHTTWGVEAGLVALPTLLGTLMPGALLLVGLTTLARPALAFLRRR